MAFEGLDFGILTRGVPQIDPVGSITRGMQLRELVQAKKDDQAMRELSQQAAGNLPQLADLAQQRGLYKQAGAIRKQHYDTQKEIATIQETLGKVDKQKRDAIFAGAEDMARMASWAKTPEDFNNGLIEIAKSHPILGGLQQGPDGVPMLPEKLQKYWVTSPEALESARALAIRNAMPVLEAMKTLAPKIEERSGAQVPVTTDVTGRQTVGAPVGFKAQTEAGKAAQDQANAILTPEEAAALKLKATTHSPGVTVNTGEKLPPGWRKDPNDPNRWIPIPGGPHDANSKDKPLTEAQGNALGFGVRAREADVILNELEAGGANVAGGLQRVASSVPGVGNYMTPEALQKYDQAKRNFVSAVLRKESGAAISAAEFANEDKKYFPQPGDKPEVIQQKRDARKTAIGVLQIQAGRDLPEVVKPVKPAKPGAKQVMTMDDARATAASTGKTVGEVIDAAKRKGWEVR